MKHGYSMFLTFLTIAFIAIDCEDNKEKENIIPKASDTTDIDGNVFHTIKIGNQIWMTENLKVTHFRNGDPIANIPGNSGWNEATTGAYCCYNNNVDSAAIYGYLYNFFAISDSRNICPDGWHVPSNEEWMILVNYLGGEEIAGGKLKETGYKHWMHPNYGADNSSGFIGLPGGKRTESGEFAEINLIGLFWTSTEDNMVSAIATSLRYDNGPMIRGLPNKKWGMSIRCIKD